MWTNSAILPVLTILIFCGWTSGENIMNFKQFVKGYAMCYQVLSQNAEPNVFELHHLRYQQDTKAVYAVVDKNGAPSVVSSIVSMKLEFNPLKWAFMNHEYEMIEALKKDIQVNPPRKSWFLRDYGITPISPVCRRAHLSLTANASDALMPFTNGVGHVVTGYTHTLAELCEPLNRNQFDEQYLLKMMYSTVKAIQSLFQLNRICFNIGTDTIAVNTNPRSKDRIQAYITEHDLTTKFKGDSRNPDNISVDPIANAYAYGATPTFTRNTGLYHGQPTFKRVWWQMIFAFMGAYNPPPWKTWIIAQCLRIDLKRIGETEILRLWKTYIPNKDSTKLVEYLKLKEHPAVMRALTNLMNTVEGTDRRDMKIAIFSIPIKLKQRSAPIDQSAMTFFHAALLNSCNFLELV